MRPPRVIGVGNRWRGDDAAGLHAARRVRELAPEAADVVELEGEPVSVLDSLDGAGAAIVIDAVVAGAVPGTVHRIDATAGALPSRLAGPSTHLLGLADAIELGRALGRLPGRLVVYGIEGERFEAGWRPTPAVTSAIEATAAAIVAELPALRTHHGADWQAATDGGRLTAS